MILHEEELYIIHHEEEVWDKPEYGHNANGDNMGHFTSYFESMITLSNLGDI